jgi:hypothetical protein
MDVPRTVFDDPNHVKVGPADSIRANPEQLETVPMRMNGLPSDFNHAEVENGCLGIDKWIPEFWDNMDPGTQKLEITLYENGHCNPLFEKEFREVLCRVFKAPELSGSHEMVAHILDQSNYQLVSIRRCQDKKRWMMHTFFQKNYAIEQHEVSELYHGTTKDNAKHIKDIGFRTSQCRRGKFGRGIYAANKVWEALMYAEPDDNKEQRFFVVRMCVGTSQIGESNTVNFGKDGLEREIVTTTNFAQTHFCAAYEDQVYPQYEVTVRYALENPPRESANTYVRRHHEVVWDWICDQMKPVPSLNAAENECTYLWSVEGYAMGSEVELRDLKNGYSCFNHATGRIVQITKKGKIFWLAVELHMTMLQEVGKRIQKPANRTHKTAAHNYVCANGWIHCRLDQVQGVSFEFRTGEKGYRIGDRVTLTHMVSNFIPFKGEYGVIRQIISTYDTYYFVEMERADLQDLAKSILETTHEDVLGQGHPSWVRCTYWQIKHATLNTQGGGDGSMSQNSTVEAARAGKRKMMDFSGDAGAN